MSGFSQKYVVGLKLDGFFALLTPHKYQGKKLLSANI
jgi:hypothetical protein